MNDFLLILGGAVFAMVISGIVNYKKPWVGLTEEEVDEIYTSVQEEVNKHWDKGGTTMFFPFTLYKALEQALKEKNT